MRITLSGLARFVILGGLNTCERRDAMALLINHNCINCDMCEPECPNQAIAMGEEFYQIDPARCTECVGHYPAPTCQKVCPIDHTILIDPLHRESGDQLWDKFVQLHHCALI